MHTGAGEHLGNTGVRCAARSCSLLLPGMASQEGVVGSSPTPGFAWVHTTSMFSCDIA